MGRLCFAFSAILIILAASIADADTRVAVIAPAGSDAEKISSLIEVSLSANAGVQMVDRQQFAAVLQEQQLAACFGPDDITARLKLGVISQADVIVALREQQTPSHHLQMVVFETRQGLRLLVEPLALTADIDTDARQLGQRILFAIRKREEGIASIFAVPQFVCDDLTREFADAGDAYASVVEQSLLQRKGVVVVEIDEAQAIAREMAIAAPAAIDRPLPFILLGNFSDTGTGASRKVSVSLTLKHGDMQVSRLATSNVDPADLAATLLAKSDELVGSNLAQRPGPVDPEVDARQLEQRGAEFLNASEFQKGLALCNASLLVKPTPEAHRDAAFGDLEICFADRAAAPQAGASLPQLIPADRQPLLDQGLDHVEACMKSSQLKYLAPADHVFLRYRSVCPPEAFARMLVRVAQVKFKAGIKDDTFRYADDVRWDLIAPSPRVGLAVQLSNLAQQPSDAAWIEMMIRRLDPTGKSPEISSIASELSQSDNALARSIAAACIRPVDAPSPVAVASAPAKQRITDPTVKLVPIAVGLSHVFGCTPIGDDLDLFWGTENVDGPVQVRALPVHGDPITLCKTIPAAKPAYDGQYVWAVSDDQASPKILIIDPAIPESIMTIGIEDGLPNEKICGFAAAPLAPGRICAAIAIGSPAEQRSYVAILSCKPDSDRKVIIVHEQKFSRLMPGHDRFDPRTAFQPRTAERLMSAPSDQSFPAVVSFPTGTGRLLINFPTEASMRTGDGITVTKDPLLTGTFVFQGKIYGTRARAAGQIAGDLLLSTVGGGAPVVINHNAIHGPVVITDRGCFIFCNVDQSLYAADTPQQPFRRLTTTVPKSYLPMADNLMGFSNRFGLLLFNSERLNQFQNADGTPVRWK